MGFFGLRKPSQQVAGAEKNVACTVSTFRREMPLPIAFAALNGKVQRSWIDFSFVVLLVAIPAKSTAGWRARRGCPNVATL
jgi:hypothetical protein